MRRCLSSNGVLPCKTVPQRCKNKKKKKKSSRLKNVTNITCVRPRFFSQLLPLIKEPIAERNEPKASWPGLQVLDPQLHFQWASSKVRALNPTPWAVPGSTQGFRAGLRSLPGHSHLTYCQLLAHSTPSSKDTSCNQHTSFIPSGPQGPSSPSLLLYIFPMGS